jgi:hypothetical protein
MEPKLKDILEFAFGGPVPDRVLDHLLRHRASWDDEFKRRLDELAFELAPDLATWTITVAPDGQLREERIPFIS